MSLRSKILLILAAVVTLYAVGDNVLQKQFVAPSFSNLERREAKMDALRVKRALEREVDELSARARDWARWDDTCNFVETGDPGYVTSNLGHAALDDANIHLLYLCDPSGKVVWSRIWDPELDQPKQLQNFPTESLGPGHPLMKFAGLDDDRSGLMVIDGEHMIISSRQIVTSNNEGPSRGVVIIGRFLSERTVADIRDRTGVEFDHWWLHSPDLPEQELLVRDEVTSRAEPYTAVRDEGLLYAYTTVDDILYQDPLLVRANVPREISAQGGTAMRYAFLSTIAAGMLMLLVLVFLLQRTVLAPIAALTNHAVEVGRTDDTESRIESDRADEIGILSREFDSMLQKLGLSRAAVIQTARAAGMSEIATGVLHNVGNVLNSVNVSASIVAKKVDDSSVADLMRVMDILDAHADDLPEFIANDPKGKHLHPFLKSLTTKIASNREALEEEVRSLNEGIDHIKVLIKAQQTYAKPTEINEATDIGEQIESALKMSYQVVSKGDQLEIHRDVEDLPKVRLDRHKLMEILINLILNARQAMTEAGIEQHVLRFAVKKTDPETVRITVTDEGPGISQENLVKIFNHGFTTKKEGNGFGLHTAANAATEMGGALRAESDGPGHGATFVLDLPFKTESTTGQATEAAAA